jgi:diadenosine tetraphosphate (Ap4A) HIT family hydrolase
VVAKAIGAAQMAAFAPQRIGMIIAGMEVPHTHLHVIPIDTEADLNFARADAGASADDLDAAADRLRAALVDQGRAEAVQR